uniref:PR domain zinc finger protein 10 n=1 Tax=Phallusia mammillata TaxID=59560 RepID=A0A6F9DNX9_9ASCI|nr:PR domain zinc finger protein 10 [Phallusia mammillata]
MSAKLHHTEAAATTPMNEEEEGDDFAVVCIPDKPVKSKARASLPNILTISKCEGDACCIITKCLLRKGTQFGPLDAPLTNFSVAASSIFLMRLKFPENIHHSAGQFLEVYFNTTDENQCNWMCLVRPALTAGEQNLSAHLKNGQVFFITIRDVQPREEIKVWYSKQYAAMLDKSLLTSTVSPINRCSLSPMKRVRKTKSSTFTPYFEEDDMNEAEVRSVPPKKRGWRRANMKFKGPAKKSSDELNGNFVNGKLQGQQSAVQHELNQGFDSMLCAEEPKWNSQLTNSYRCCICGKGFKRKHSLTIHSVVHSDTMSFLCHTCGKRFKRKDKLREHYKRMHVSKDQTLNTNTPVAKLKSHSTRNCEAKQVEMSAFKCRHCSVGFRRRGMLVNHMLNKHPGIDLNSIPALAQPLMKKSVSFMCPYCKKSYKSVSKRSRHIVKHHPGQKIPPGLRETKMSSITYTSDSHIAYHEEKQTQPCLCPYCPSQYTSRNKLSRHITKKHSRMKPQTTKTTNLPHVQDSNVETIPGFSVGDVTHAFEDDIGVLQSPSIANHHGQNDMFNQPSSSVIAHCMETDQQQIEHGSTENSSHFDPQLSYVSQQQMDVLPTHHQQHDQHHEPVQFVAKINQQMPHTVNHIEPIREPLLCDYSEVGRELNRPNEPSVTQRNYYRPRKHHLLQARCESEKSAQSLQAPTVYQPRNNIDPTFNQSHFVIHTETGEIQPPCKIDMQPVYATQNTDVSQLPGCSSNRNLQWATFVEYQPINENKAHSVAESQCHLMYDDGDHQRP